MDAGTTKASFKSMLIGFHIVWNLWKPMEPGDKTYSDV